MAEDDTRSLAELSGRTMGELSKTPPPIPQGRYGVLLQSVSAGVSPNKNIPMITAEMQITEVVDSQLVSPDGVEVPEEEVIGRTIQHTFWFNRDRQASFGYFLNAAGVEVSEDDTLNDALAELNLTIDEASNTFVTLEEGSVPSVVGSQFEIDVQRQTRKDRETGLPVVDEESGTPLTNLRVNKFIGS